MIKEKLQRLSKTELANRAKRQGIAGYRSLKKEELIDALAALAAKKAKTAIKTKKITQPAKKSPPRSRPQLAAAHNNGTGASAEEQIEKSKYDVGVPTRDLADKIPKDLPRGYGKDRIVCMVRDPYWLHCYWELTRQSIQRAEAALAQAWHGAKPILRVLDVTSGDSTSISELIVKDVEIHGGANNWYVEVSNPPRSYRIDIGY